MIYDRNSRTFRGKVSDLETGKRKKLAIVQVVDESGTRVATFKITVSLSPKGNPEIHVRSKKPNTGEWKNIKLMCVPEDIE